MEKLSKSPVGTRIIHIALFFFRGDYPTDCFNNFHLYNGEQGKAENNQPLIPAQQGQMEDAPKSREEQNAGHQCRRNQERDNQPGIVPFSSYPDGFGVGTLVKCAQHLGKRQYAKRHGLTSRMAIQSNADPVSGQGERCDKDPLGYNTADQIFFKQSTGFHRWVLHNVFACRIYAECQGRQGCRCQVDPEDMYGQKRRRPS